MQCTIIVSSKCVLEIIWTWVETSRSVFIPFKGDIKCAFYWIQSTLQFDIRFECSVILLLDGIVHLPWTNKSITASGLCRSFTRQMYSAVSVDNAGWNCKLKSWGESVICSNGRNTKKIIEIRFDHKLLAQSHDKCNYILFGIRLLQQKLILVRKSQKLVQSNILAGIFVIFRDQINCPNSGCWAWVLRFHTNSGKNCSGMKKISCRN